MINKSRDPQYLSMEYPSTFIPIIAIITTRGGTQRALIKSCGSLKEGELVGTYQRDEQKVENSRDP
jgi:hypothetical protein